MRRVVMVEGSPHVVTFRGRLVCGRCVTVLDWKELHPFCSGCRDLGSCCERPPGAREACCVLVAGHSEYLWGPGQPHQPTSQPAANQPASQPSNQSTILPVN
ncbi:hypothetical protein E2C01_027199 [Portunus trituberculatus]|uniref:Uncharacterized protein n=1 Tax=Portunus trituberculatus TaxID=210409 RepID=A0A5B7ELB5_PORTR|nr:hypothetical protein [Portunus trituberculatus]